MTMRVTVLMGATMWILFAADAQAFSFTTTSRNDAPAGNPRAASVEGTYVLDSGESLKSVSLVYDIGLSIPATAAGQFSASPRTWKAGVSDYQMRSYRVEFVVQRGTQKTTYKSQTFTYGK